MTGRDTTEPHRVSSPLELLFDLTFVVAIAQVTAQLAHAVIEGHAGEMLIPFAMVFFAIWWAWMNFTWFASAYDTDDVPYRLLVMVQMIGVLVLAAGVPAAFNDGNLLAITIGFFVMRLGLAAQWIRAGIEYPDGRRTAFRYSAGIVLLQVGWWARLSLPGEATGVLIGATLVLIALELCVPPWAERTGGTPWHPHHIAERYGLFTIILLGESVLAATTGVQNALVANGVSVLLVVIAFAGFVLLFGLWWLYFLEPAGEGLEVKRGLSYAWGYGHYGIFAALAAVGAGLEVAVEAAGHHLEISAVGATEAVAIPTAIFLVLLWLVHVPLVARLVIRPAVILPAAAVVLALPFLAPSLGIAGVVIAIALVCAVVIAATILARQASSA